MNNILLYRLILQDIFQLEYIPHVVRKSKITWGGNTDCYGMYYGETVGKRIKHRIEYYYKTTPEIVFATLAHEYVHALQMEQNLDLDHDGEVFKYWEDYFRDHFDVELQFN